MADYRPGCTRIFQGPLRYNVADWAAGDVVVLRPLPAADRVAVMQQILGEALAWHAPRA
jgi:hypothetical protein